MSQPTSASALGLSLCLTLGVGLASTSAHAAGGVFVVGTEAAPSVTTTDATAVFVVEDARTQMHLRLELDLAASNQAGESLAVAWVVPLPSGSTFAQSSERLFANLSAATVPTWRTEVRASQCPSDEPEDPFSDPDPDATPPLPPGIIASYEPILAPATSIDALRATLEGLGYAILPGTESTLAPYVGPDRMVAIVNFIARRGHNILHPIAFELGDRSPELAVRLTETTAGTNANLHVYMLADERQVPSGWVHVVPNLLQVDWLGLGNNWQDVAGLAVAEEEADGQAFVTEAFESSDVVSRGGLLDARWDETRFTSLAASQVATELVQQGLYTCYGAPNGCQPRHPLVDDLLEEFLLPAGITIAQYFDCPTCYVDALLWRPVEFADAFRERVVVPGRNAADRLSAAAFVTRMYTRIGNGAVVSDPKFTERPDDDPIRAARLAGALRRCSGDLVLSLPDRREVVAPRGGPWPQFVDEMPFAERVEQLTATGDGIVLVDNRETIDALLADHNAEYGWPPEGGCSSCRTTGGSGPGPWLLLMLIGLGARRRGPRIGWAAALALLSACAGRRGGTARPKPTAPDAIAAELDRNERELANLGIDIGEPAAGGDAGPTTTAEPEPPPTDAPDPVQTPTTPPPEPMPEPDDDDYADAEASAPAEYEEQDSSSVREKRRERAPTRCDRICDLAEATCELADHVCRLAEDHEDDPRYAEACTRAERQCRVADEACRACE